MTQDFDDSDYGKPIKVLTPEERDKQYGWEKKESVETTVAMQPLPAPKAVSPIQPWYPVSDYLKHCIKNGLEEEFILLMNHLPEATKEKYRAMWKEEKEQK